MQGQGNSTWVHQSKQIEEPVKQGVVELKHMKWEMEKKDVGTGSGIKKKLFKWKKEAKLKGIRVVPFKQNPQDRRTTLAVN